MSVTVGLDPMWQAGKIRVREQFAPALEVEGGLSFRGTKLDRQRHSRGNLFYSQENGKLEGRAMQPLRPKPDNSSKEPSKTPGGDVGQVGFRLTGPIIPIMSPVRKVQKDSFPSRLQLDDTLMFPI